MSRSAVVDPGTTEEMTTPVISLENESPVWSRSPANSTASSSAVRSVSVDRRHWCSSSSRGTPRARCWCSRRSRRAAHDVTSLTGHPAMPQRRTASVGPRASVIGLTPRGAGACRSAVPRRNDRRRALGPDPRSPAAPRTCPRPRRPRSRCEGRGADLPSHRRHELPRVPLAAARELGRLREREEQAGRGLALLGDRSRLRLESARPSGSRTTGQHRTSTGIDRSRTIRRITASCCASFSPKYAEHAPTVSNSLATTVATPRK